MSASPRISLHRAPLLLSDGARSVFVLLTPEPIHITTRHACTPAIAELGRLGLVQTTYWDEDTRTLALTPLGLEHRRTIIN